jgi:hypothetical protein
MQIARQTLSLEISSAKFLLVTEKSENSEFNVQQSTNVFFVEQLTVKFL